MSYVKLSIFTSQSDPERGKGAGQGVSWIRGTIERGVGRKVPKRVPPRRDSRNLHLKARPMQCIPNVVCSMQDMPHCLPTCRTKSTTSSIMGSSTSIASRDPVPAQLMPIARQDPKRMCALNDSASSDTRRGTCNSGSTPNRRRIRRKRASVSGRCIWSLATRVPLAGLMAQPSQACDYARAF